LRRTRMTSRLPAGMFEICVEAKCRNCLETLWRTTDPPTDLFTMSPTKGALELLALV
jgi:hypothetical protein